jgi:hypothetical protein
MTPEQLAALAAAAALAAYAAWNAMPAGMIPVVGKPTIDECATDALALAAKLRAADCPEGVAACQTLLNVILQHPSHAAPEVRT